MKKLNLILACMLVMSGMSLIAQASDYPGLHDFHDMDQKLYPGSLCRSNDFDVVSYWRDWVFNTSNTRKATLVCPIVKDSLDEGDNIQAVFIYVHDRNPDYPVVCSQFRSNIYRTDVPGSYFSTRQTVGATTDVQVLDFNLSASDLSDGPSYTYSIECSIPGEYNGRNSGVLGYYVWEKVIQHSHP